MSFRMYYAQTLFEKGCLHAETLAMLVRASKHKKEVDIGSICAISRIIIETHNKFFYLTESNISSSEFQFRQDLMLLNADVDLEKISISPQSHENCDSYIQTLRAMKVESLQSNPIFGQFDKKTQSKLLKGKTPCLMERYKGKKPLSIATESALYNLFSHSIHSYGLSGRYSVQCSPAGYINSVILAVESTLIFLGSMTKRYTALRPRTIGQLTQEQKEIITLSLTTSCVEKLIVS